MSQPTLPGNVRALDESLDVRVFERGPRSAALMLREQDWMLADVSARAHNQTIERGVHSIFPTRAFARCIAAFSQSWPNASLRIRDGFSSDLIERLLRGEPDLRAVRCRTLPSMAGRCGRSRWSC